MLLYLTGLLAFVFRSGRAKRDDLAQTCEAICLAYLAQLVGGPVFSGVTGALFWLCMGPDDQCGPVARSAEGCAPQR